MALKVIARVANFADPLAWDSMINRALPVGEVVEREHDLQHIINGLKDGELDPADEATASTAGPVVLKRWHEIKDKQKAELRAKAEAAEKAVKDAEAKAKADAAEAAKQAADAAAKATQKGGE